MCSSDYDFEADDFKECLLHLVQPHSEGAAVAGAELAVALKRLAYRRRHLAKRYDTQNIAPHSVQTTQR